MADTNENWLAKQVYLAHLDMFGTAWEPYIKFHTMFVTVNVTALAVTVQFIDQPNRWPLVVAFIVQNIIAIGTALAMSQRGGCCAAGMTAAGHELLRSAADESAGALPLGSHGRGPENRTGAPCPAGAAESEEVGQPDCDPADWWAKPIPVKTALWAGVANALAYVALIGCWVGTLFMERS